MVEKELKPLKKVKSQAGIELGIKTLVVDSNGNEYTNIKPYRTLRRKIKLDQTHNLLYELISLPPDLDKDLDLDQAVPQFTL